MITFGELKTGPVGRSSGLDVTGQNFKEFCNDAVRQLMQRGNWFSTVVPIRTCVNNGTITWPRGVSTILGINYDHYPQRMANMWYQFMQPDSAYRNWASAYRRSGWFGDVTVETRGLDCVFNPIVAEGFTIRTFVTLPSDVGKTITFYGIDANGQPIITQRSDGTIQPGVQVILAQPSVDTPIAIRHVTKVVKDVTDGDLICYMYNLIGQFLVDMARYQPTETNPQYITTVLRDRPRWGCGCGHQVTALVSMDFVPFSWDNDLVQIDSEDALRDMLLSVRRKESGDIAGSAAYEVSALRELNYQMRKRYPDEQFIVNFRPFGRDDLNNSNTRIGMI